MTTYEIDVDFDLPDGYATVITADGLDDAEYKMIEMVKDNWPDAKNIEVTSIKEVKTNNG